MVESQPSKLLVAGSIPVSRSIKFRRVPSAPVVGVLGQKVVYTALGNQEMCHGNVSRDEFAIVNFSRGHIFDSKG